MSSSNQKNFRTLRDMFEAKIKQKNKRNLSKRLLSLKKKTKRKRNISKFKKNKNNSQQSEPSEKVKPKPNPKPTKKRACKFGHEKLGLCNFLKGIDGRGCIYRHPKCLPKVPQRPPKKSNSGKKNNLQNIPPPPPQMPLPPTPLSSSQQSVSQSPSKRSLSEAYNGLLSPEQNTRNEPLPPPPSVSQSPSNRSLSEYYNELLHSSEQNNRNEPLPPLPTQPSRTSLPPRPPVRNTRQGTNRALKKKNTNIYLKPTPLKRVNPNKSLNLGRNHNYVFIDRNTMNSVDQRTFIGRHDKKEGEPCGLYKNYESNKTGYHATCEPPLICENNHCYNPIPKNLYKKKKGSRLKKSNISFPITIDLSRNFKDRTNIRNLPGLNTVRENNTSQINRKRSPSREESLKQKKSFKSRMKNTFGKFFKRRTRKVSPTNSLVSNRRKSSKTVLFNNKSNNMEYSNYDVENKCVY